MDVYDEYTDISTITILYMVMTYIIGRNINLKQNLPITTKTSVLFGHLLRFRHVKD